MKTYEITLDGFSGNSDETDDLVLWIAAPDRTTLELALGPVRHFVQRIWGVIDVDPEDAGVDFTLAKNVGSAPLIAAIHKLIPTEEQNDGA